MNIFKIQHKDNQLYFSEGAIEVRNCSISTVFNTHRNELVFFIYTRSGTQPVSYYRTEFNLRGSRLAGCFDTIANFKAKPSEDGDYVVSVEKDFFNFLTLATSTTTGYELSERELQRNTSFYDNLKSRVITGYTLKERGEED